MKIYIRDLPYKNKSASEAKKEGSHLYNHAFNLDRLPNESLRRDFASFIFDRAADVCIHVLGGE